MLQQDKEDMVLMLFNKISFLEARVNVNRLEFQEMMSNVTKSPFLKRIVEVEEPLKYAAPKVKEYKRDLGLYRCMCHFE